MFDQAFYIDIDRPGGRACLLDGKASAALPDTPMLVQGDVGPLKLFFRRRGVAGAASTPMQHEGASIVAAGKHVDDMGAATLLFSATSFVETGTGDDLHYLSELDLTAAEIGTKLGTGKEITVRVDVEVQTPGNTQRITYQFDVTVRKQGYSGEATPTPGTPPYPHPDQIVTKVRGTVEIGDDEDTVEVTNLGLEAAPAQVLLTLRKPDAAAPLLACNLVGDPTADGFTAALSGATPDTGYKLDYLLIL